MATRTILSPELTSMELFRSAIPESARDSVIADRLCAIGQYRNLTAGEELPGSAREDRLVYVARGVVKLIARLTPPSQALMADPAKLTRPTQPQTMSQRATGLIKTQILAFHFPGDIISVLRESDGDFRLVALQDAQLIVFFAEQFLDVAQDDPVVIRSMLATSIRALHASRTRMMQLGHKSAGDRLTEFLTSMAQRICGCTSGACEFALPMNRRDIADSLGLTIETVSRQFAELREAGLIETQGRSIIKIRELRALACRRGSK